MGSLGRLVFATTRTAGVPVFEGKVQSVFLEKHEGKFVVRMGMATVVYV